MPTVCVHYSNICNLDRLLVLNPALPYNMVGNTGQVKDVLSYPELVIESKGQESYKGIDKK